MRDNTNKHTAVAVPAETNVSTHDERTEAQNIDAQANTAVPAAEDATIETINLLTLEQATKDIAAYWPFVLRTGVFSVSAALESYIIAQKKLDYVGAYTAYEAAIGIAIGFLYSSIFPLVTLMSAAKREEDANKGNPEKAKEAREKIRAIWRQGFIFASALSVPAVVFGLAASPIFKLFKQPDVVTENSQLFLWYSTPGFVADIYYRFTARAVSGLSVRKSILAADTIDVALQLFFSYAFLNGKFGMPELGLPGVGAAYSLSKIITVLGHLSYIAASPACLKFDYKKYELFSLKGPFFDKAVFKKLVGAGIPDGLNSVFSAISTMLVVMFCGQSGTAPLVGLRAASVFSGFANFHMSAVLNAACSEIGKDYEILQDEENKYTDDNKKIAVKNAKLYTKLLFGICGVMSLIACGLAFAIPKQLSKLMIDESDASNRVYLDHAINFIKIQGAVGLIHGVMDPAQCVLESLLDNSFLMYATIIFDLICNPAAAAATHYGLHKNSEWVFSASNVGTVLMMVAVLYRTYKKLNVISVDRESVALAQAERSDAPQSASLIDKVRCLVWGPKKPELEASNIPGLSAPLNHGENVAFSPA